MNLEGDGAIGALLAQSLLGLALREPLAVLLVERRSLALVRGREAAI